MALDQLVNKTKYHSNYKHSDVKQMRLSIRNECDKNTAEPTEEKIISNKSITIKVVV